VELDKNIYETDENNRMDSLDKKIIALLQEDGTATNAGIAKSSGVSEETVRRRLKRLITDKCIKVVAVPDPAKLGFESEVLIGIRVESNKVDYVAEELAGMGEVNWVSMTTGSFDIFAWATLRTASELSSFLRTRIGSVSGVLGTESFVSLGTKKRDYSVAI